MQLVKNRGFAEKLTRIRSEENALVDRLALQVVTLIQLQIFLIPHLGEKLKINSNQPA